MTDIAAPEFSIGGAVREALGLSVFPRLLWSLPTLRNEPRGDGSTVVVLPGFAAGDASTLPLRAYLGWLGYDARGWGLGVNRATVEESVEEIGERARELAASSGRPVSLVGWSLGGTIAREAARDHPDAVRAVVTFGSPVIGGPKYTTAARFADSFGWDLDDIAARVEERKTVPLRVPVTAIYSRRDGVVAWQACVDDEGGTTVEHVESQATHLGLGVDAETFRVVARRIADAASAAV